MQCQCMYRPCKLFFQCFVDEAVAGNQHFAVECLRHGNDLEMGFGTGWHIVHMALIDDFQVLWVQGVIQLVDNIVFYTHMAHAAVDRFS